MVRTRRFAGMALALSAVAFLLTGCLKLDMALTLSSDNTVSGSIVFAFDKTLLAASGQSAEEAIGSQGLFSSDTEGVTSTPYKDDKFEGVTYTFESIPLSKFAESSQADSLTIKRVGDEFIVSGTMDMSGGDTSTGDPTMDAQVQEAFKSAEIRIAITFPGEVVSSNGTVSGNTVTWTPKIGEKTTLEATGKATAGSSMMLILILAGVALIVVVVVVVLISRKGKGSKAPEAPAEDAVSAEPPAEVSAADPAPPAAPVAPTEDPAPPAPPAPGSDAGQIPD